MRNINPNRFITICRVMGGSFANRLGRLQSGGLWRKRVIWLELSVFWLTEEIYENPAVRAQYLT